MKIMMSRFTASRVLLALVLGLVASYQLSAYTPYGWKWKTLQVDYYINSTNRDVPIDVAVSAVKAGAAAWTAQSSSPFSFAYVGVTKNTTVSNNGRNEVFFRNSTSGAAIATTYYWSSGGTALDADIIFWDGTYQFFGGSTGCVNGFYIQDVATHEFGHALGLGHSLISEATMVSGQQYCSTTKRSLASDDIQAVEFLYPPTVNANKPPVITIVAPLPGSTFTTSSSILFSGTALDPEDGVLSAGIKWTSSINGLLGTASSLTRSLSAGTHTITASVTDPDGATRSATTSIVVTAASSSWTFLPNLATIQLGQTAILSFTTTTANVHNIFISGQRPSYACLLLSCSGTLVVAPAATTTYTLTSTNSSGTPYPPLTTTVTVTTAAAPVSPVWTFTSNPSTIQAGQSSVLSFTVSSADVKNVSINGQVPAYSCGASSCSGSLTVTPAATTSYTLNSTNSAGTPYPSKSLTVTVTAPSTWTFTAKPATIQAGQSSVLSFTTTTANFHNVFISGRRPTYSCGTSSCSGSLTVAPAATTSYTLTSTNNMGTPYPARSVTVTVTKP